MPDYNLPANVALVNGYQQGTGFFIGCNGTLLTCFHVIGDIHTGQIHCTTPRITFGGQEYPARVLRSSPNPRLLDAAILQLDIERLPAGTFLLPLATWRAGDKTGRFTSFGFRSADQTQGLHAQGEISGLITLRNEQEILQLGSQPSDAQQIRPGMSGAPVALQATGQIVGMVVFVVYEADEIIPCAIPLEQIARFWPALEERLLEDDLLEQLRQLFLSPTWFTDTSLRYFYAQLPALGSPHIDATRESLVRDLVDQLRGQGQLYDVINLLREYRRDIPLAEQLNLPPTQRINFVNREDEFAESCGRSAIPYLLYDAPLGYGKTELLKAIERRHFLDNWICLRVAAPAESCTVQQLVAPIAEVARVPITGHKLPVRACGYTLAGALATRVQDLRAAGVILLIDDIEKLHPEQIPVFLNEFLVALVDGLGDVEFRLRLTGCYADAAWKNPTNQFDVAISTLTPFRFQYVCETLKRLFPKQNQLYLRAAHVMQLTGGHPGCMAQAINSVDFGADPDQILSNEATYRDIVLAAADEVRMTIPQQLREIFDVLSLFRRYNLRILEYLLTCEILCYAGGVDRLEEELTATYLVTRQFGFIQDDIVRRLLCIRLQFQEPERFLELCLRARDTYVTRLRQGSRRTDVLVAEALYQEARAGYYSFSDRAELRKHFFAPNGPVTDYLTYIANDPDPLDTKRNFEALLTGQKEADWELRFALNYFLRDTDYSEIPFQLLLQRVKSL